MKRLISILILLSILIFAVSCGNSNDGKDNFVGTNNTAQIDDSETSDSETSNVETSGSESVNNGNGNSGSADSGNSDNSADDVTKPDDDNNIQTYVIVTVGADKNEITVGENVVFTVNLNTTEKVASCAFKLQYDTEIFELVSGETIKDAIISDFSNSIGVIAFAKPMSVNANVMTFTMRAKATVENSIITCEASIIDENDNNVEDIDLNSVNITVK